VSLSSRFVSLMIALVALPLAVAAAFFLADARRVPVERARARLEAAVLALTERPAGAGDPHAVMRLTGLDATVVEGDAGNVRVVESTLAVARGESVSIHTDDAGSGEGTIGGRRVVAAVAPDRVVLSIDQEPLDSQGAAAARSRLLVVLAVGAAVVAVAWLAGRRLVRPLVRLTEASERVAGGAWVSGERVSVEGADEVERIGAAVNSLGARLRTSDGELKRSRDDRTTGLVSFGAMLEATHDRDAVLALATDVSRRDVGARGAALFLMTPQRNALEVVRVEGSCGELRVGDRLALGRGLAGAVAESGRAGRAGRRGTATEPMTAAPEPAGEGLAAPIRAEGRLFGILALYGRVEGPPYDEGDVALLTDFARQTGVGVENVLSHEEAERLAIHDPVSGTWNRHYFDLALAREVERAVRFDHDVGLAMLDLDDFKDLNDTFGHPAGDAVLAQVAGLVTELIREVDVLARYGGEEFVLILPETDLAGSLVVAQKIRMAISESAFSAGAHSARVTVSLGVASLAEHGTSPAGLVSAADQALYEAKRLGKNRVQVAGGTRVTWDGGRGSATGKGH